ncbi:hypothetical protein BU17DRAFT_91275 [Hysterangium stoloniferum]|nr:hypothetical protein BU17DRAFT_91275 [Hysterangium stoloniferum]
MSSTSLTDTGAGDRLRVSSQLVLRAATTRVQFRAVGSAMKRDLIAECITLQKDLKTLFFFDREFDEAQKFLYLMSPGRVIYPDGIPAYLNMPCIKFECLCALLLPGLLFVEVKTIARITRTFCSDCGLNASLIPVQTLHTPVQTHPHSVIRPPPPSIPPLPPLAPPMAQPNIPLLGQSLMAAGQELILVPNLPVLDIQQQLVQIQQQQLVQTQILQQLGQQVQQLDQQVQQLQNSQNTFEALFPIRLKNATASNNAALVYPPGVPLPPDRPILKQNLYDLTAAACQATAQALGLPPLPGPALLVSRRQQIIDYLGAAVTAF